jgi:hypothetical protein
MISRQSAKAIADAYRAKYVFVSVNYRQQSKEVHYWADLLYDFLYLNNFADWFTMKVRGLYHGSKERVLQEYIMRLHTGGSLVDATPEWTPQQRSDLGQRLLRDLAEALIRARHTDPAFETHHTNEREAVDAMQRTLELDGYVYRDGTLYVPEESVVDEREEHGVLNDLVSRAMLADPKTILHHLELSASHYTAQRWDDSIANSRKVLEAILQQIAAKCSLAPGQPALSKPELEKPVVVRDYLESVNLLDRKEKDAISRCYALLSDTGGHPHIAERDQARLMRHLALTFSQFVLLRYLNAP